MLKTLFVSSITPTRLRHFLLMTVSLAVVMAMPEPPLDPPPYPTLDGPGRFFYSAGDNVTGPPAGALEAYCQVLLQAPVPVPPDQIPLFCRCSHCQSSEGPKGDRGDRGQPGERNKRAPAVLADRRDRSRIRGFLICPLLRSSR